MQWACRGGSCCRPLLAPLSASQGTAVRKGPQLQRPSAAEMRAPLRLDSCPPCSGAHVRARVPGALSRQGRRSRCRPQRWLHTSPRKSRSGPRSGKGALGTPRERSVFHTRRGLPRGVSELQQLIRMFKQPTFGEPRYLRGGGALQRFLGIPVPGAAWRRGAGCGGADREPGFALHDSTLKRCVSQTPFTVFLCFPRGRPGLT